MSFTVLTFPYQSILTSAKMTQLQDNFTAQAQGLTGAPKFQKAALNSSAVDFATIINNVVADGSLVLASAGSTAYVPAGAVNLACSAGIALLQVYINGNWRLINTISYYVGTTAHVLSDGSNARVIASGAAATVAYRRMFK